MKYCADCGSSLENGKCPNCSKLTVENQTNDNGSFGWGVLGFFFPLIGLILFILWKDVKPKSSKSSGIGALIGVILYIILVILAVLFFIFVGTRVNPMVEYV